MTKALTGVRVVDLTRLLAGPTCTMVLADLGADVVKVEEPGSGDDARFFGPFRRGESGYFMTVNRGKRGITLDLHRPEGQDVLRDLVRTADVLLESFAVGVMDGWGVGWPELSAVNPRLVYASITGYGHSGPNAGQVSADLVAQAAGGLMSLTGHPACPPTRAGTSLADIVAGQLTATAILAALHQRSVTGRGQRVDVSMQDAVFSLLENAVVRRTLGGEEPGRIGSRHPSVAPFDTYRAADGFVSIACVSEATWRRLCLVLERPDLDDDERFAVNPARNANVEALTEIVEGWLADKTVAEALELLRAHRVPAARVASVKELVDDPHLRARKMLVAVDHPVAGPTLLPGNPLKLSDSPDTVDRPAPTLGQHTDAVLRELGYPDEKIAALREAGVV